MDLRWAQSYSTLPSTQTPLSPQGGQTAGAAPTTFADVLREVQNLRPEKTAGIAAQGLRWSAHAEARMRQRGVSLTQADMQRLDDAVAKAARKGSKDTYVLYGNTGFVVNVPNRTVVTAMVNQEETIVTNIDSVVIVPRLDRQGGLAAGID